MAIFQCLGMFKVKSKQRRLENYNMVVNNIGYEKDGGEPKGKTNQVGAVEEPIRKFSWDEIERFTENFSTVIGTGGFSTVYLAHLDGGRVGAIKINPGSERLTLVFREELDILRQLHHQNIVKLIGYSNDRDDQGALVFEYVPNGSLQEKLHGGGEDRSNIIPWKNRMAIAFQVAQALEYLHEKNNLPIVHGDIKPSNILLDTNMNCRLCDFGTAKKGFSSAVQPTNKIHRRILMTGSPGYTDPHYLRTGIPSKKNDVYAFGVLLLELVTGREAFCSAAAQSLTTAVGSKLAKLSEVDVEEMVDSRLGREFDEEEARVVLSLAAQCISQPPSLRPSATHILETIETNVSSMSFLFSDHSKIKS
ncbi:hypothetical protein UlMin_001385 [Ulmus minor]